MADDFLSSAYVAHEDEHRRIVGEFRRGWRVQSLVTVAEAVNIAASQGLRSIDDMNLTPYLALGRPRDRLIRVLVRAMKVLAPRALERRPRFANLIGGDALQRGLQRGLLEYHLLVFGA